MAVAVKFTYILAQLYGRYRWSRRFEDRGVRPQRTSGEMAVPSRPAPSDLGSESRVASHAGHASKIYAVARQRSAENVPRGESICRSVP